MLWCQSISDSEEAELDVYGWYRDRTETTGKLKQRKWYEKIIWEPRGRYSEIFKNKKVLITKIWPSSWSVSIIFSPSRDFKMQEQSYIYISYSVPFRDLAQCSAPSPWRIIMGNLKSKVSSINKPDLCRQTNSEPPLTCRVYKLMLGNNLTRYNPGSRREESGLVEWFLWGF